MTISVVLGWIGAGVAGWYLGSRGITPENGWREAAFVGACGLAVSSSVQLLGALL